MNSVVVENISKQYRLRKKEVQALRDISFSVDKGELFGIIGPDGAGKTTLFRILTTLLLADSGVATIAGFDVVKDFQQIRNLSGYMPGRFSLYMDLSVEENLEFFATIFHTTIQENYSLIEGIYKQIEPFKARRAGQLSGGMKQKLALCCALIHRPSVLFLDEPTTGVDVVSRKDFWEMLHRLKKEGITILVSTSYMDEAALCDRVALLQKGSILAVDTPQGVIRRFSKPLWAVRANEMFRLLQAIRADAAVDTCFPFGQYHHVTMKDENDGETVLRSITGKETFTGFEYKRIEPRIEDCFMALMKE